MPIRSLGQSSFFDPEQVQPDCLEPGTVPWLLARYRSKLMPPWLFRGWRGQHLRGRKAWPAVTLMTLLLLRWSNEGVSRLGATKRAKSDVQWRAAMGLAMDSRVPDEKTVRDFEAFLRKRSQCERLINQVVRHGGRQARCWGLRNAQLQAHAVVMTCNLRLLAKTLAATGDGQLLEAA